MSDFFVLYIYNVHTCTCTCTKKVNPEGNNPWSVGGMYHWRAGIPVDLDMASHSRPCSAFPGVICDCVGVGGAGWPLLSPGHAETLARGRSHWPEGHTSCTVTATNPVYVVLVSGSPSGLYGWVGAE